MEDSDKKIMSAEDILKIFKEEEGWTILKHNTDIHFCDEDVDQEDYDGWLDGSILSKKDIFEVYYEERCSFILYEDKIECEDEIIDEIKIKTSEEIFYYDEDGDLTKWNSESIKDLLYDAKVENCEYMCSLEIIIPTLADIQKEKTKISEED